MFMYQLPIHKVIIVDIKILIFCPEILYIVMYIKLKFIALYQNLASSKFVFSNMIKNKTNNNNLIIIT